MKKSKGILGVLSLTSGEYSYLMLRKMQSYVSCKDSQYRAYLYNFYGSIFNDPSVVIDGESYSEFCDLMDSEMDYAAKKGLRTPEDIYYDVNFSRSYAFLQNSFAIIGIDLELSGTDYLLFTLPSGEQRKLEGLDSIWYAQLTFNCQTRMTDEYFSQANTFMMLEQEEVKDLKVIGHNAAGYNTRWTYDEDTHTLEISGNGTLANWGLWSQLGITDVETLILGAGVYKLEYQSFNQSLTIVDLHGEADIIKCEDTFGGGTSSAIREYVVYSDNLSLKEANWGTYTKVEWHPLSEWEG